MNHKHINNHINKYNMNVDKSTNVVGDEEKAREFSDSVNHISQSLDQWLKEDTENRSYMIILARKEGEEGEEGICSIFNGSGNKAIMKQSLSKAMEVSIAIRKMIIGSQQMFVANTIRRMMSESDDDDEIEPEVDYDDRGEEVDDTDKPEGGER